MPQGWHGGVVRVSGFPVPEREVEEYRRGSEELIARLRTDFPKASTQVYLQFHRLLPGQDIATLQQNARLWLLETGLGVWPDREPPRLWTKEDLEEAEEPAKVRPLMYKVMKVQDEVRAGTHAWETMAGRGCLLQIGTSAPDSFQNHATELFVPRMEQSVFASFPFYVPLLEAKSCAEASAEEMNGWLRFCGFYLRESAEDGGLLAISAKPLEIALA